MRYFTQQVFDASVSVGVQSGPSAPQYSDLAYNALLGSCESLTVHVHATAEGGTPNVTVDTEGSNDGQEWLVIKTPLASLAPTVGSSVATIVIDNQTPRTAFIRYKVTVAGVGGQAGVRILATGRGAL